MASPGPSSLGAVSEDRRCLDPQPVSRRACRLRRTLRAPRLIALMSSSSAVARRATGRVVFGASKRRRVARALGLATLCSLALGACGSAPLSAGAGASLTAAAMGGAIDGGTAYFAEQPETTARLHLPARLRSVLHRREHGRLPDPALRAALLVRRQGEHRDRLPALDRQRPCLQRRRPSRDDHPQALPLVRRRDGERPGRDLLDQLAEGEPRRLGLLCAGRLPRQRDLGDCAQRHDRAPELNAAYNPIWYTYNELSQITPLPLAWDRTSLSAPAPWAGIDTDLPDTTPAGSKSRLRLPERPGQGRRRATHRARSGRWSTGPGSSLRPHAPTGGDLRPQPARFPDRTSPAWQSSSSFPSRARRQSSRCFAPARRPAVPARSSGDQISVGYVPDNDVPQSGSAPLAGLSAGRLVPLPVRLLRAELQQPDRRADPAPAVLPPGLPASRRPAGLDPRLLRRARGSHLRPGAREPAQPVRRRQRLGEPVPVQHPRGRKLLAGHGWKVDRERRSRPAPVPARAPGECGKGIRAGEGLNFTLMYPSGLPYTDGSMVDLQSVAKQVGIEISLKEVTPATIALDDPVLCPGPGRLQLGARPVRRGMGLRAGPLSERRGDLRDRRARERLQLLEPGHRQADRGDDRRRRLRAPRPRSTPTRTRSASSCPTSGSRARARSLRLQSNLHGFVPNAYGFISPEEWYFTKA